MNCWPLTDDRAAENIFGRNQKGLPGKNSLKMYEIGPLGSKTASFAGRFSLWFLIFCTGRHWDLFCSRPVLHCGTNCRPVYAGHGMGLADPGTAQARCGELSAGDGAGLSHHGRSRFSREIEGMKFSPGTRSCISRREAGCFSPRPPAGRGPAANTPPQTGGSGPGCRRWRTQEARRRG